MSDGTMYEGRIQDTASENFGPFPVQTDEEAMTAIERGIFEQRQALTAALVDAAALREQLAAMACVDCDNQEGNDAARGYCPTHGMAMRDRLETAESAALTNGEALAGSREALQSCVDSENAVRAERGELRGLLDAVWEAPDDDAMLVAINSAGLWLVSHPAAIPEGTPGEGKADGTP